MKDFNQRVWVGQALIGVVFLALLSQVVRLAYIQQSLRPELLEYSRRRQCSKVTLPGRRGAILDRRYRVLAGSHDHFHIYADPQLVPNHAEVAVKLEAILGIPAAEIQEVFDHPTSPRYVMIARGVSSNEAEGVELLDIRGLGVRREPGRTHPMGTLGAHVLGFVGADSRGLEGVERVMDRYLKATPGERVVYRDVRRRAMFQAADSYVAPRDGMHVVLTLDAAIQETVERELQHRVEAYEAESGIALVMSPRTGEVLAMACAPTFDPVAPGKVRAELRRNRILTDPVEPGSIFKPFVFSAALAHGLTRPDEVIDCERGMYKVGRRILHDHHANVALTAEQVIIKSSNIGMAKLGERLGNPRIHEALLRFGFGRVTGIDLPGEGDGLLMPLSRWRDYTTLSVPMGQELAVTPTQLLTAFCAIANGGRLLQPRIISKVLNIEGEVIEDRDEVVDHGQALDPGVAATLREILVKVVEEGTGKGRCQLDKWLVMGKTGTAQVPWTNRRGYEPHAYLASFIAAAPASDPRLAVLVMIRKPNYRKGYYGGVVAAPVAKAILEQALPYINAPADRPAKKPVEGQQWLVWNGQR